MKNEKFNPKDIPGYGMDADPENEPNYPMKNYTGDDHSRLSYERSEPQNQDVEVLMSTERPEITRVFGTSVPPSGLSGMIRRYAFSHSEDRLRHWMPLILADRINVYEGLISDFKLGKFPNLLAERGMKTEWKYNKKSLATRALVFGITTAIVASYFYNRSSNESKENRAIL